MPSRKQFIKDSAKLAIGACCLGSMTGLLSSCSSLTRLELAIADDMIKIPLSAFLEDKMVLVKNPQLAAPIYVASLDNGQYAASLMLCTHKACKVNPTGDFMTCPCHGSEFSKSGRVLSGPANRDLTGYKIVINENELIIKLNEEL